jgi:signal transduction histidine kinase
MAPEHRSDGGRPIAEERLRPMALQNRVNRHSELPAGAATMDWTTWKGAIGAAVDTDGPAARPFQTAEDEDVDSMGDERELNADDDRGSVGEPVASPDVTPRAGARGRPGREPGDLVAMKWLGIGLPIVLLVAIECFRYLVIEDSPIHRAEHVAIAAVTAIGIVCFALLMFHLVERTERRIVRQNRELTAINAVSTAVQGELAVEQLIDAALHTVIDRTDATEASVVVFAHDGAPDSGLERRIVRAPHASAVAAGEDLPHLIDIPLARGTAIVGRMRLHMPEGTIEPDLLASTTLQNIGHQLACSIQIGQLVGDMQRRKQEGHALYDVLLSISNQRPLAETLAAVARHAHDLLLAEEAMLCLTPASSALLDGGGIAGAVRLPDGSTCISSDPSHVMTPETGPFRPHTSTASGARTTISVALASPDLHLGDLRADRAPDAPFTHRDRAYLQTLGELATIAITSARMRENEHQAATLVERERIAREMHDSLAQVLGVVHLRLRALGGNARSIGATDMAIGLAELADIAEEAYRDVREAILGLRESSHTGRGLIDSLRGYVEKYERQSGIATKLETDFDAEPRLSPRAEVQIIRVIQEALTNVRKHAGATSSIVRVTSDDAFVTFRIEDNGRGFDLAKRLLDRDSGFGLHAMRERIESIGGTLAVDSAPGHGTALIARVPALPGAGAVASEVHGGHGRVEADVQWPLNADPRPARR